MPDPYRQQTSLAASQVMLISLCQRGSPLGTLAPSRFDPWGQEGDSKQGERQVGTMLSPRADPDPHMASVCTSGAHGGTLPLPPCSAELPAGALET